jgi:pilus assembly protein CpaC
MTPRGRARLITVCAVALAALTGAPSRAQQILSKPEAVISVQKGHAATYRQPAQMQRVAVADPAIAEAVVISGSEVLINGLAPGTTSMVVWDKAGGSRMFEIRVTIDTSGLQDQFRALFPGDTISIQTVGGTLLLSGLVRDTAVGRRAVELAQATGAKVQGNFGARAARQILLQVRFGEVTRSALQQLSSELSVPSGRGVRDVTDAGGSILSDGVARLFLLGPDSKLELVLNALKSRGLFKSLAEPNLVAVDGHEASFLAGGEFPFPVTQGAGLNATVTVVWKEFGVRLKFRPRITPEGNIRLLVSPEVSSLDFANGLRLQGDIIPSLVTRRADTEVELVPGQHLGIAGLIDNSIRENASRIPGLGDIPILGALFRSKDRREEQSELLVIVTPYFVESTPVPPAVPGGEPGTWKWEKLKPPPDTTVRPGVGRGGGAGAGGSNERRQH